MEADSPSKRAADAPAGKAASSSSAAAAAAVKKSSRPIFGSLAKIVAEEFGKHTVAALQDGLKNMPAAESLEPMRQYIEGRHMEVVDLFDIFAQRSVFNPHFIQDPDQRERVAEIFHNAVDAQTIREAIRKSRQQGQQQQPPLQGSDETAVNDPAAAKKDVLAEAVPTEDELEKLKEKIQQLSLRQEELAKKRAQLQSSTKKVESCETLLHEMEQGTASAVDAADIERVRSMLQQAQSMVSFLDKAKQDREEIEKTRKRKEQGERNVLFVVPKQRKKRASFGTRYNQSVETIDTKAMAAIMDKIFKGEK
jgi:hypothetical protein